MKNQNWMIAMNEELSMIEKNKTWILVEKPRDRKMIEVKWVYRTKLNVDGFINKNKARLVVKGYNQIFSVDYSDTFAPVARLDTIRKKICVEQPEGFVNEGEEDKVYLFKKALYDLKQAPRAWYSRINEHLLNLGFAKSLSKSTLYVKHNGVVSLIILLYVDDLLVTGNHISLVEKFKLEIMEVFEMTDLATRPNILNVISILSQFIHYASEMYLKAAKRVIRYVKGTSDFGIKFKRSKEVELCSKRQEIVAQSIVEAEFIAATSVVNQAIWLRKILNELNMEQKKNMKILIDNQAAIVISHNLVFHGKTKHFNIKLFFLREVQRWRCDFSLLQNRRSGTKLSFSTAFHPQTNGQSDKVIQFLEDLLRACVLDLKGNWDDYLPLVEFAYNNSFQASIGWHLLRCYMVRIKERLKAAQSRQKSYANNHRQDLEFEVGDHVFLKVSPMKSIMRFGRKVKLSPRSVGPFEVLERVGILAYKLTLPPSLSKIHNVFHVSTLRKYIYDPSHVVELEPIQISEELTYEEVSFQIVDVMDKVLLHDVVKLVKIQWSNHSIREATWESEEEMREKHPHLFQDPGMSSLKD
ncbi:Retrovirus-related Pol polyprotein from transposon RE2 [Vitis vinifera]|uniref:Retrovirus-related Pol polyprotein from transposon RE2 n=1 Tax=Vitis vinifera TaxID=29760 RepID=A0A438HFE9_VITVI|nr:Retrovirus-related Pol polyprotein from transposon RE2 [Vitis vinifera]